MTNFIEYAEGKTYDAKHLRPFNLELAKLGHPLATYQGNEVKFIAEHKKLPEKQYVYFSWQAAQSFEGVLTNGKWNTSWLPSTSSATNILRLAPLAIKDGKPLHVGDVIEIKTMRGEWDAIDNNASLGAYTQWINSWNWRWPVENK